MLTYHNIWYLPLFYWDWLVTKWAYWDLNILKTMNTRWYSRVRASKVTKENVIMYSTSKSRQSTNTDTWPLGRRPCQFRGLIVRHPRTWGESFLQWNLVELKHTGLLTTYRNDPKSVKGSQRRKLVKYNGLRTEGCVSSTSWVERWSCPNTSRVERTEENTTHRPSSSLQCGGR